MHPTHWTSPFRSPADDFPTADGIAVPSCVVNKPTFFLRRISVGKIRQLNNINNILEDASVVVLDGSKSIFHVFDDATEDIRLEDS